MICRCGNEVQPRTKNCTSCGEMPVKRGEVFWTDRVDGLEIGIIPILKMQNDRGNANGTTVIAFYSPHKNNCVFFFTCVLSTVKDFQFFRSG
ncbi:MAG: hypothetical protein P0Y55_11775 [Candidatus Cohnella colombiensis]|uniref:Uncharacterized protein n=1 Tax=Candidatus Cohnella colombiensis TaxID=3121368 RepID=A0AA95EV11_9BACL|nr:MAG: hypothetical protein P0Y55_11775 [Cohnella sp.]